jgi:predicted CXXCH cytochrome family protein
MKNVQCEACHGPTEFPNQHPPEVNYSASLCGTCHKRNNQPTIADWEASLHAVSKNTRVPGFEWISSDSTCSGCHTAEGFVDFVDDAGYVPQVANPPGQDGADITCQACHNPHSNAHEGQLRLAKEELCTKCHQPLYDPQSPPPVGTEVHHTTSWMFEGIGGYEYEGYEYPNSSHTTTVIDKCVGCHYYKWIPGGKQTGYTGHRFTPEGANCLACHADFDTTTHSFDYRGIQSEIETLTGILEAKLAAASHDDSSTIGFLRAAFNRDFVAGDGSKGIHNTGYARALLISTIAEFNPMAVSATITTVDSPVVIPAQGGSFEYVMTFSNLTDETQVVDIWTRLIETDGSIVPVFGPRTTSLPPQATRSKTRTLVVPGTDPPGAYRLVLFVGGFDSTVFSSDTLTFTKAQQAMKQVEENTQVYDFALRQNHPNPFNPVTTIVYTIPRTIEVRLDIFNMLGQRVGVLVEGIQSAGYHSVKFEAKDLPSGIYLYRLQAGEYSETRKLVLTK